MRTFNSLLKSAAIILIGTFTLVNCSKDIIDIPEPQQEIANDLNLKAGTLSVPGASTLTFSGYTWNVRTGVAQAPGPNNWSRNNAWVDSNGKLHLKMTYNTTLAKWECAEVSTAKKLGFGKYEWTVDGKIDQLNQDVVLGLFNYLSASTGGTKQAGEIDIEFSKWGIPNLAKAGSFTVWPPNNTRITNWSTSFAITAANTTTSTRHSFTWTSKSVAFQSLDGLGNKIATANYAPSRYSTSIPQLAAPAIINLWLFRGTSVTLPKDQSVEVIISKFTYSPM
jgi:hypothetical protein